MLVTEGGMLIRTNASEIRRIGRATIGVRVIRLNEGDRVVSVARAEAVDESEDEDSDGEVETAAENGDDVPAEES